VKLGGLLERGLGGQRDLVEACKWYLLAQDLGNQRAQESLQRLKNVMPPAQWEEANQRAQAAREASHD
jgi:TPR repeat protein